MFIYLYNIEHNYINESVIYNVMHDLKVVYYTTGYRVHIVLYLTELEETQHAL